MRENIKKLIAGKRRYILSLIVTLVLIGTLILLIYVLPLEKKYWLGVILLLLAWFTFGRGYSSFVKIEGNTISHKDFLLAKYSTSELNETAKILLNYDGKVIVYLVSEWKERIGSGYRFAEQLFALLPKELFQVKWSGASRFTAPLKHREFLLQHGLITKEQFDEISRF